MERIEQDREFLKTAQETMEAETKEFIQVSDRLHNNLTKALKLMWRQLLVIWAVVFLLFIAYFSLLSKTSTPDKIAKEPDAAQKALSPEEMTAAPTRPPANAPLTPEWAGIRGILDQIREAQLKKDLNLFFEAYSPQFPDLDQKKKNLLKTWQKYDYVDMTFKIDNIQRQPDDTFIAKVVWDIIVEDVTSKKKRSLSRNYTIRFSNDSGKWLIQELQQESNARQERLG